MFVFFDEAPTSTSLLLQCGYRSKVCTNHRATKLDGTLHKLCEFHKANLNQQRLHKRQREKRARLQEQQQHRESTVKPELAPKHRPAKKARPSLEPVADSVLRSPTDVYSYPNEFDSSYLTQYTPLVNAGELAFPKFGSTDMDILELLLLDMQPQPLPPLEAFLPSVSSLTPASIDNQGSIAL
jgi:hypothetical protein